MAIAKSIWQPGVTLESLRTRAHHTLVDHLGIELTELGPDFLSGTMPVNERTCQPLRILHGGASVAFAETLASFAANAVLNAARFAAVGQEINANHLRPVAEGEIVSGVTRAFHIGARSQVWSIEIMNSRAQRVCVSRITLAVVEQFK